MSEEAKTSISGVMATTKGDERNKPSLSAAMTALNSKRAVIKSADMKTDLQHEAIEIAIKAFENNGVEKDVAENIKKEFDNKYGATWHCIVGRNFDKAVVFATSLLLCCAANDIPNSLDQWLHTVIMANNFEAQVNWP
ncbi:hypothetical protein ACFE04_007973 [Oxalis oulophora]